VRERIGKDHFVVGVLFRGVSGEANEQITFQQIVVVFVVAEHDGLELSQTNDMQDSALRLLHFEFILELLRLVIITHIPRPLKVLILLSLIIVAKTGAVGPPCSIIAFPTGFVGQDLKGVYDLAKGFCGFIGRNMFVLVGMCVAGFATIRLFVNCVS
jgi:hypothetical protein